MPPVGEGNSEQGTPQLLRTFPPVLGTLNRLFAEGMSGGPLRFLLQLPQNKIIGKWGSPALRLCSSVIFFRVLIEDESSVTCVPGLNSEAAAEEAPASQPATRDCGVPDPKLGRPAPQRRPDSGTPTWELTRGRAAGVLRAATLRPVPRSHNKAANSGGNVGPGQAGPASIQGALLALWGP